MIDISIPHLKIIKEILRKHVPGCEVRAFGSRVMGTAKDYSDFDLAIVGKEKLHRETIHSLQNDFEESNLPFRVDVLDWNAVSIEFQLMINKKYEVV